MKIIGNRIEVVRLDYAFITGGTDHDLYGENELEEWAKNYKLDVRVIGSDEVTPDLPTSEEEKTPLELLAQRTANEHEEAFGKMMEAMADMAYSKVQEALTVHEAVRERSKEICGLTNEWRVKVEAEKKHQWEEKHRQKVEGSLGRYH